MYARAYTYSKGTSIVKVQARARGTPFYFTHAHSAHLSAVRTCTTTQLHNPTTQPNDATQQHNPNKTQHNNTTITLNKKPNNIASLHIPTSQTNYTTQQHIPTAQPNHTTLLHNPTTKHNPATHTNKKNRPRHAGFGPLVANQRWTPGSSILQTQLHHATRRSRQQHKTSNAKKHPATNPNRKLAPRRHRPLVRSGRQLLARLLRTP